MKQSTKRLASAALGTVLILAAFVLLFDFVQPDYQELSHLRGQLKSQEDFESAQKRIIDQVQQLIASFDKTSDAQQALALAFPLEPMAADVLGQLNGLLLGNSIPPQTFTVAVEAQTPSQPGRPSQNLQTAKSLKIAPVGTVSFHISGAATYDDIKRFFQNVETNIRIMDVTDLDIQPAKRPTDNLYTFNASVAAYYQKELPQEN